LTTTAQAELVSTAEISPPQLLTYWQQAISYDLNQQALTGLRLFYNLAYEINLIKRVPELTFFPEN
jgi:predicted solute-binding protein